MRVANWRGKFSDEADKIRTQPFIWGEHDCWVGLVGNLTKALTGEDKAERFRGRYQTASGAYRVMKEEGFDNLGDLVASLLPEIQPSQTQIGDIAAIPDESGLGYVLGIVNGERILILMENGLGTVDLSEATRAFKVG